MPYLQQSTHYNLQADNDILTILSKIAYRFGWGGGRSKVPRIRIGFAHGTSVNV